MLNEQERAFLVAVLRELRFAPEAAENAVFAKNLIAKLSTQEVKVEEQKEVVEESKEA